MNLGEKIKLFRKEKGYTQREMGILMGFTDNTADVRIRQYESNKKYPNKDTLHKIAIALGVELEDLKSYNINTKQDVILALREITNSFGEEIIINYIKENKEVFDMTIDEHKKIFKSMVEKSKEEINVMADSGMFNEIIKGYIAIAMESANFKQEDIKKIDFYGLFDTISGSDARKKGSEVNK